MKKRFLGLFLVFALLFACVPGMAAQAAGADLSANVKVSEFRFLTDGTATAVLMPGKTVTAECKLERTATGTNAQNYCFLLQVIDNGKLIDLKKTTGSISAADGKKTISVTSAELGADTSKYEVIALLVSDMETMTPLAMPANFKNSTCEIASITVAGNKLPLEAGKTDYSMNLSVMEDDLPPAIEVVPYDLSTSITVNNISGTSGTATVTAVSHDGTATAQYNIALNITALTPASLKSVTVDGTPLANFDPGTLTYRIHPTTDAVPVIAFETALASTTATVTAATELPGTTVVKTKAEDGSEQTYQFQFTKTVEVTAFKAAEHYVNTKMAIGDAETMSSFLFDGNYWNQSGHILNTKGGSVSKAYFAFRPNLSEGAVVESAEMTLKMRGVDKNNIHNGTLSYDVFENTDTAWTGKAEGQYTDMTAPAYGSTAAGTELAVTVGSDFSTATSTIRPSVVQGKEIVSFTGVIQSGSAWDVFALLSVRSADLPKLKITYYKEYAEPEQLSSVTFDGVRYSAFDPNTLEYKIPSAEGQTTAPVIAATAGAPTTTVTVSQASGFPGKATVTTEAANGKSLTYTFIFMKTIEVTAFKAAEHREETKMGIGDASSDFVYNPTDFNMANRVLNMKDGHNSKAYFAFRPNLPIDAVVENAEMTLMLWGIDKKSTYNGTLTYDVFENTDTSWTNKTQGQYTDMAAPAYASTAAGTTLSIPSYTSGGAFSAAATNIKPDVVQGKEIVSFTGIINQGTPWDVYAILSMRSDELPELRITYYQEDSAAEGKVTAVSVGGKRLTEFDPDTYEYVIKTDVGATEAPEITYALANGTTATYTPATELPGTATIVTSGGFTYTFKLAKTVQMTPAAAAVSLTTGGKNLVRSASENLGNYNFSCPERINRSGRIFVGNKFFKDKAYIAFQPNIPADAVIDSAELDLAVSATGSIQHVAIYENTDTAWMSKAGEQEATAPAYDDSAVLNSAITLDSSYTKQTYSLNPVFAGRSLVSFTIFTQETTDSWNDYAVVEMRDVVPTLRISYHAE